MNATQCSLVLVALALGCSDDPTGPCGGSTTATSVGVCDNFFAPSSSPINGGASVTWTWGGSNPHNVTFEDGQGSSATQNSGTHSRTFGSGGNFRYRCTIHSADFNSGMVGVVTVP